MRFLVHPVSFDGQHFMPYCYGYAMTIRRAQGSTLDKVGLWFDHTYPADRGYAYVGSSRVRRASDLFLMGKIRRTDWLPVGGDSQGGEQETRGYESTTTEEDSDEPSSDEEPSEDEDGSQDEEDEDSTEDEDEASKSSEDADEGQGDCNDSHMESEAEEDEMSLDEDE